MSHHNLKNPNFPTDDEGRVMHVAVKAGDVAPRILTVGDVGRAQRLSLLLDAGSVSTVTSKRGFVTHTGTFDGVPVSIIATGMGLPMIDLMLRETRAVCEGPMAVIRFGTCGCVRPDIQPGCVVVAENSLAIQRDYDSFLAVDPSAEDSALSHYRISLPVDSDKELSTLLSSCLQEALGSELIKGGLNATADSFYSSQGRTGVHFDDHNESLLQALSKKHSNLTTLEMETFHLFHLAHCSKGSLKAAAACIVLFNRETGLALSEEILTQTEQNGGRAVLATLARHPLTSN
eukprot:GILI01008968.1.p1 GENE.GILI01008968.1~~GILI01008968.1.p1  ORF type:complete len:290 (+),score=52.61 GILI01008968.1:68-937(+)